MIFKQLISEKWSSYREDDVQKARFVKKKKEVLDDCWWDKIEYILYFTRIFEILRACKTDKHCLHLIYDMWDTMIENVRKAIYSHKGKDREEEFTFYTMMHQILVDRRNKNNTTLHYLAH